MNNFWTGAALWLAQISVAASCLIFLTLLLARFTRQPARRQRLCEAGLAAALVAVAVSLAPAWVVIGVPLKTPAPAPADSVPEADEFLDLRLDPEALAQINRVAELPPLATPAQDMQPIPFAVPGLSLGAAVAVGFLAVYGVGTLYFLVRWLAGVLILRRLLQDTEPVSPQVLDMLGSAPGHGPRLLVSRRLRVPISCGVWRPTVVLPVAFCRPAACARLRWVLAHELTHIERKDALSALLFALGQVAFFHLPWFWMLRKQVRLCQEYVADAAAVAGRPADEYAEFLLTLTENKALPLLTTGVGGPVSDLFRRVTMLLQNPLRVEKRCPRLWTWGLGCVLLALAALLGGVGLRAAAADTIIIIIPGKQAAEPAKDKTADAKKTADRLIRTAISPDGKKVELILDDKGDIIQKLADVLTKTTIRALPAVPPGKELPEYLKRLGDFIQQREKAQKNDPAAKEWRELFELIKVRQSSTQSKDKIIALYDKGLQPLPAQTRWQAYAQAQSPVDWKKLEKLLEQIQKAPDKVDPKEISKALEEIRKATGTIAILATPDVPYDQLIRYVARLNTSADAHGRFGLRFSPLSNDLRDHLGLPKEQGLVIEEVFAGTPAAKAGLKAKDIVLKLNDQTIPSDSGKAAGMFANVKDGTSVDMTILRRGKEQVVKGIKPAPTAAANVSRYRTVFAKLPVAGQWNETEKFPEKGALVSILTDGGKFTAKHHEKNLSITIKGSLKDGKAANLEILVEVEGKEAFKGAPAGVPEAWRPRVIRLLELIRLQANPQSRAPEPRFRDNLPQGVQAP